MRGRSERHTNFIFLYLQVQHIERRKIYPLQTLNRPLCRSCHWRSEKEEDDGIGRKGTEEQKRQKQKYD
jgi:hypothetical protein